VLQVRVVTDRAELVELRDAWGDVARRGNNQSVFATWEWAYTWLRHYGCRDALNLVVVLDDERIVGIAPLLRARLGRPRLGFDALLPIGAEHADYSDFLLGSRPQAAAGAIADYLVDVVRTSNTLVHLIRFVDDDPMLEALCTRLGSGRRSPMLSEHAVGVCPYMDLSEPADAARAVAAGKKRHGRTRRMRQLREEHEVAFQYHVDREALDWAWREVTRLHEVRWDDKTDDMQGLLSDERGRAFAVEVVRVLCDAGLAKVSLLTADGVPISGVLGFEVGRRYHYHKPGFDPAFSKFAPGNLLVGEILDFALAEGLDEFNFGRGGATYKYSWADRERNLTSVWITRSRLRGRLQRSIVYRNRLDRLMASDVEMGPWASLPALAPHET
jgi:CelD/BcsL family acetyltransferase involved in cellulose biosynthesis